MPVRVRGESVVTWEVVFQAEDGDAYDHNDVSARALEYVADMLDLHGIADIEAKVDSQKDRVMTVRGLSK